MNIKNLRLFAAGSAFSAVRIAKSRSKHSLSGTAIFPRCPALFVVNYGRARESAESQSVLFAAPLSCALSLRALRALQLTS